LDGMTNTLLYAVLGTLLLFNAVLVLHEVVEPVEPTSRPTARPTFAPTKQPTKQPSRYPTEAPVPKPPPRPAPAPPSSSQGRSDNNNNNNQKKNAKTSSSTTSSAGFQWRLFLLGVGSMASGIVFCIHRHRHFDADLTGISLNPLGRRNAGGYSDI